MQVDATHVHAWPPTGTSEYRDAEYLTQEVAEEELFTGIQAGDAVVVSIQQSADARTVASVFSGLLGRKASVELLVRSPGFALPEAPDRGYRDDLLAEMAALDFDERVYGVQFREMGKIDLLCGEGASYADGAIDRDCETRVRAADSARLCPLFQRRAETFRQLRVLQVFTRGVPNGTAHRVLVREGSLESAPDHKARTWQELVKEMRVGQEAVMWAVGEGPRWSCDDVARRAQGEWFWWGDDGELCRCSASRCWEAWRPAVGERVVAWERSPLRWRVALWVETPRGSELRIIDDRDGAAFQVEAFPHVPSPNASLQWVAGHIVLLLDDDGAGESLSWSQVPGETGLTIRRGSKISIGPDRCFMVRVDEGTSTHDPAVVEVVSLRDGEVMSRVSRQARHPIVDVEWRPMKARVRQRDGTTWTLPLGECRWGSPP